MLETIICQASWSLPTDQVPWKRIQSIQIYGVDLRLRRIVKTITPPAQIGISVQSLIDLQKNPVWMMSFLFPLCPTLMKGTHELDWAVQMIRDKEGGV